MNLPAVLILVAVTAVLVIGIRESAMSNTLLVLIKVGVVLFVIVMGVGYVNPTNWTDIPYQERRLPEEVIIPDAFAEEQAKETEKRRGQDAGDRTNQLTDQALAVYKLDRVGVIRKELKKKGHLRPRRE